MKTHTEPATPDLPILSPEDAALFQQFVQNGFDLPALAAETGRLITDLLRWFFTPPIRLYVDALQHAAEIAVELAAARTRPTALQTLQDLAATAQDPLERRRAASSLATHSRPVHRRTSLAADKPTEAPQARAELGHAVTTPADERPASAHEPHEGERLAPFSPDGTPHPISAAPQAPPAALAA